MSRFECSPREGKERVAGDMEEDRKGSSSGRLARATPRDEGATEGRPRTAGGERHAASKADGAAESQWIGLIALLV